MNWNDFRYLLLSDLYRITGRTDALTLFMQLFKGNAFRFNFWFRLCAYSRSHPVLAWVVYPLCRLVLRHLTMKLGISIPYRTRIGAGFYIGHFGGIVVNRDAVIGRNCNISHGVTIGQANRGRRRGSPVIGDNVYIGPGAKLVGAVRIGDNAAIGANSVVTRDVPDNGVVVGIPGQTISTRGSEGYVNCTDYDSRLRAVPVVMHAAMLTLAIETA